MATQLKIGLVSIPVMIENTINKSQNRISFKETHLEDGGELGRKKYCKKCNKIILTSDEVGKKYGDNILTIDEYDNIKEFLDNNTIEILGFSKVDLNVKKRLFYASYYLLCDITKNAKKSYQKYYYAFRQAIKNKGVVGTAIFTSRGTQHLGYIYVDSDERLIISLLPFSDAINNEIERLEGVTPTYKESELPIADAEKFIESINTEVVYTEVKNNLKEKFKAYLENKEDNEVILTEVEDESENIFQKAVNKN